MPSEGTEQRKLAAIMFTDMVGYSALAQRNEALALQLLEDHRSLLRALFPRFNGREVKTIGDAFLVEFHSALEAAQCAIEIQRTLAKRNHDVAAARRIEVRIGIHIGDVVQRADGDVLGDGVNIASRIEPLAGANGICISVDVERQIRNTIEASLVKLGATELKNIQVPMELFRIVLPWETQSSSRREEAQTSKSEIEKSRLTSAATKFGWIAAIVLLAVGISWWFVHQSGKAAKPVASSPSASPSPAADRKFIAVLPFANTSADRADDSLSDGMTDELINTLQKVKGLRVQGRTSSFFFKGKNESIQKMGEQLRVDYLLEGSVSKALNKLRITAQLVAVADGFQLWSTNYDRDLADIFAIRSEVAQQVAGALKFQLGVEETQSIAMKPTESLEAYDLYLHGRELWNKRTAADIRRAIGQFEQATEKDPKFPLAYAGLAACYAALPEYAYVPVREAQPKARAAARRALELDRKLPEAHAALGLMKWHDWDWPGAEKDFQRAISLNPNYAMAHKWLGGLLENQARFEEALAEFRKAQALDPLSGVIQENIGELFYSQRRYDQALAELRKTLDLVPGFASAYRWRGRVYLAQHKYSEAIAEFEKVRTPVGEIPYGLGDLGHAYSHAGRTNDARQVLQQLKDFSTQGASVGYDIAFVHLGLGDRDQAFTWLERSAEDSATELRTLKVDPLYDSVRNEPRFQALLKKVGLDK